MCKLVINNMLCRMVNFTRSWRHFQYRTRLRQFFLIVIFSVNCVQIVRAGWSQSLYWLETFVWVWNLVCETVPISCAPMEFISRGKLILLRFWSLVRVHFFSGVVCLVGCVPLEWLVQGVVGLVFVVYGVTNCWFSWELLLVFRLAVEGDIAVLVSHSWDMLLSHLGLVAGIRLLIIGANVPIRLSALIFYIPQISTLRWWLLPSTDRVLMIIMLIRWKLIEWNV